MASEEQNISLGERAAQLAQTDSQQLLGYIAALLELVTRNQVVGTETILEELRGVINVSGDVEVTKLP
jgi:hypothetical protein